MQAPVAMGQRSKILNPKTIYSKNGDCRIKHREYLIDITSSTSFHLTQYAINPGIPSTFPWLCLIALRFESYKFNSLKFEFMTEAPTTTSGSVVLGIDYDPSDAAPTTKQQLMAYQSTVRSSAWAPCTHQSTVQNLSKRDTYFTRSNSVVTPTELNLYDVGNLFVATQSQSTGGITIGELWVEYDVTLMTPQLDRNGQGLGLTWANGNTDGVNATNLIGTNPDVRGNAAIILQDNGNINFQSDWAGALTIHVAGTSVNSFVIAANVGVTIVSAGISNDATSLTGVWTVSATSGSVIHIEVNSGANVIGVVGFFGAI